MGQAACRGMGHEMFVIDHGTSAKFGKKVCEACPVAVECDDYAERTGSFGIWGGRVRNERQPKRSK